MMSHGNLTSNFQKYLTKSSCDPEVKLKLKPQKSSSLVIKGRKCINKQPFEVAVEVNLYTRKEPLKTIGKVNNSSLMDRHLVVVWTGIYRWSEEENHRIGTKPEQVIVKQHSGGIIVSELITCSDWMATYDF